MDSESDFTGFFVSPSVSKSCQVTSSGLGETSSAVLDQAFRLHYSFYGRKSFELASFNSVKSSELALNGTVQLALSDQPYSSRCKRDAKRVAYDELSVRDRRGIIRPLPNLLRPRGQASLFCTA